MVLGLKEIQIRGEIRTNVDYTIDLLHVGFPHEPSLFIFIEINDLRMPTNS